MKVKDFRIGNFIFGVKEGYKETAMEIASLHGDNTFRLKQGNDTIGCYSCSLIKPISLTEEWLVKLGFEKEPSLTYAWKFSPSGEVYNVDCKYVHQLQNLYFALTGKELNVA